MLSGIPPFPKESNDERQHNFIDHSDSCCRRRIAIVALQFGLGLLPEWWYWLSRIDPDSASGIPWRHLITPITDEIRFVPWSTGPSKKFSQYQVMISKFFGNISTSALNVALVANGSAVSAQKKSGQSDSTLSKVRLFGQRDRMIFSDSDSGGPPKEWGHDNFFFADGDSNQSGRSIRSITSKASLLRTQNTEVEIAKAREVLLRFLFITRIACRTDAGDVETTKQKSIYRDFVEQILALSNSSHRKVERWITLPPTETQFMDVMNELLRKHDLDLQIRFLCEQKAGVALPSSDVDTDIETWATRAGFTESAVNSKYTSLLEEEYSRWFMSRTAINQLRSSWDAQRMETLAGLERIAEFFPALSVAKISLTNLRQDFLY